MMISIFRVMFISIGIMLARKTHVVAVIVNVAMQRAPGPAARHGSRTPPGHELYLLKYLFLSTVVQTATIKHRPVAA